MTSLLRIIDPMTALKRIAYIMDANLVGVAMIVVIGAVGGKPGIDHADFDFIAMGIVTAAIRVIDLFTDPLRHIRPMRAVEFGGVTAASTVDDDFNERFHLRVCRGGRTEPEKVPARLERIFPFPLMNAEISAERGAAFVGTIAGRKAKESFAGQLGIAVQIAVFRFVHHVIVVGVQRIGGRRRNSRYGVLRSRNRRRRDFNHAVMESGGEHSAMPHEDDDSAYDENEYQTDGGTDAKIKNFLLEPSAH